ncbi:hypothetical protein Taro_014369 [Colocasia esculenta]|uniref:WW domain-containing protein n=1 Tax=Colocasia esculenta TaxID=4460 RepID=A0A843UER2_COLES|nr:hypothetical protein [Colocasia esculenta]
MVSLQAALSQKERRPCPTTNAAGDNSSSNKKRKWEDGQEKDHITRAALPRELKLWKDDDQADVDESMIQQPPAGIDLHLDTPLPPEWQRCLDIQSGKIHFYNTRTHRRTSRDPRESVDETTPLSPPAVADARSVSLDLELNLMCETSPRSHGGGEEIKTQEKGAHVDVPAAFFCDHRARPSGAAICKTPSWVSMDADAGEMMATVCGRCHMLVMMCKSSPSCPNCKFLHAPDQMPPSAMLKPGAQALVL